MTERALLQSFIRRLSIWTIALWFVAGCAADPGAGTQPDGNRPDAGQRDTSEPSRDVGGSEDSGGNRPDVVPIGSEQLLFLNPGDASVRMLLSSATDLSVLYVDGEGQPIVDAVIEFEISAGDPRGSRLRESTSRTDADGIATVSLISNSDEAEFDVTAGVRNNSEVNTLTFQVNVRTKEASDYTFLAIYDETERPLRISEIEFVVFQEAVSCDDIEEFPGSPAFDLALPTAYDRIPTADVYDPYPFPNEDSAPVTAVIALGRALSGDTVAWACNDGPFLREDGSEIAPTDVVFGDEVLVELFLDELYPEIVGEYDVENELDLFELLPPDIQGPVRTLILFFESPGRAIYEILVDNDVIPDLGGAADIFLELIDGLFFELIPPDVAEIFGTVSNIGDALQTVKLKGRLLLFENADAGGNFGCSELVIDQVIVNVELLDETDRVLDFRSRGYDAFYGAIPGGRVTVSLDSRGDVAYGLNLDPFRLAVNYGRIILFLLEDIVFPAAFGPGVDSLDEALESIIDCEAIAAEISILEDFVAGACETAIGVAADELRDFLGAQSADIGAAYQLATPQLGSTRPADVELLESGLEWTPCAMGVETSAEGVLFANRLGAPGSGRCVWDARLFSSPSDTAGRSASAAFFGQRRRDIGRGLTCGDGE